jgi:hypothetical protein
VGRKSKYETHVKPYLCQIEESYKDLDEQQIAVERLGIAVSTFENYKKKYPELREALKKGRQYLVGELKASLKKKAKGFYYEETKTSIRQEGGKEVKIVEKYKKYAQPDTGAIHLLLKNCDPAWTNDDQTTIDLKREQLEIARQKAENDNW